MIRAPYPATAARFTVGHVHRHHDVGRDAADPGRQRERLAVVARRVAGHAPRGLLVGEREHHVDRATDLEGTDPLQVLALEEELGAGHGVERRARHHRRAVHVGGDAVGRGEHVRPGRAAHAGRSRRAPSTTRPGRRRGRRSPASRSRAGSGAGRPRTSGPGPRRCRGGEQHVVEPVDVDRHLGPDAGEAHDAAARAHPLEPVLAGDPARRPARGGRPQRRGSASGCGRGRRGRRRRWARRGSSRRSRSAPWRRAASRAAPGRG